MSWELILLFRVCAGLLIIGIGGGVGYIFGDVHGLVAGAIVGLMAQFFIFRGADKTAYW